MVAPPLTRWTNVLWRGIYRIGHQLLDLNNELPPDYMYQKYIVDMTREAYNDTVKLKKVFKMSLYNRIIIKLKKIKLQKLYFRKK